MTQAEKLENQPSESPRKKGKGSSRNDGHLLPFNPADLPFLISLGIVASVYIVLIAGILSAKVFYVQLPLIGEVFTDRGYRYAVMLSLVACSITTLLSVFIAVPTAYLMTRVNFPGKRIVDAMLDIPIVLPPLVIGLGLLMLFQTPIGLFIQQYITVTYAIPGLILAQFMVACAFSIRTMMASFSEINPRQEQVAVTLGCTRSQAFWLVVLPEARRGIIPAATIAWARAMGEFGPVLVFAGTTRMRTEVMPTTIFLELQVGNLGMATAVAVVMLILSLIILVLMRIAGHGARRF